MPNRHEFEQNFADLIDWFADRGIPPHEGFIVMASAVGAIIAQLGPDKRQEAIDLAHTTIAEAMKAAAEAA